MCEVKQLVSWGHTAILPQIEEQMFLQTCGLPAEMYMIWNIFINCTVCDWLRSYERHKWLFSTYNWLAASHIAIVLPILAETWPYGQVTFLGLYLLIIVIVRSHLNLFGAESMKSKAEQTNTVEKFTANLSISIKSRLISFTELFMVCDMRLSRFYRSQW